MSDTPYLHYSDELEHIAPDERQTIDELVAVLRSISETTFKDSGRVMRSVHAKSHGLLRGEIEVLGDLPETLRQGLFAKPGRYPVVARLSTTPGDILPDTVSTPRGMALKIVGVEGERLPGSESHVTQDLVLVNGPAFQAPDAKTFLSKLKLLAKTTDKGEGFKTLVANVFRGTEKVVEALGGESTTLKAMGGHPATHPLGETYYSQVPIRFGDFVAKVSVAPVSSELKALTDAPVDVDATPHTALRDAITQFFGTQGGEWELRVQLCTDIEKMPIEDASVVWPEDLSPYLTVARLTLPAQPAWDEQRIEGIDAGMAFSPWHGLAAHRPLGSVMRARRKPYESSSTFRAEHGRCPIHEPRVLADLPQ